MKQIIIQLDTNGDTVFFEDRDDILGYDHEELVGKSWFDYCIAAVDKSMLMKVFDSLLSGSDDFKTFTNDVKCKDGTHKLIVFENEVIEHENGSLHVLSKGIEKYYSALLSSIDASNNEVTINTYNHSTLEDSDKTLNAILDVIAEGVWDWNANTGHVDRSPGWYRMLGYEVGIFLKDVFTWENIIHPDDQATVMEHFELYTAGKIDKYEIEYRCKKADGSYLWIVDRGKIVEYNSDGTVARMIGAHSNIHERKMAQIDLMKKNKLLNEGNLTLEKLLEEKNIELQEKNTELEEKIEEVEYLSATDQLTKIANRRQFEHDLDKEIARAKRYNHSLSLVIFDIDNFKNINDKYGHKVGDRILHRLAISVKSQLRANDLIARWGGEEFVLILPDTSLESAIAVSDKFRRFIHQIEFEDGLFITCSFGIAEYEQDEIIDNFFIRADEALYKAKDLGRDRVEPFM